MDVFAEVGFEGATMIEVEGRAGFSVGSGSLYRHFRSKQELLRAAVAWEFDRVRDEMESALDVVFDIDDANERRLRAYERRLDALRHSRRLFRLMLNDGDRVPELKRSIWSVVQVPHKQRSAEDNEIEAVAEAALGGFYLFTMMQGQPYRGVSEAEFLRLLVELTEPYVPDR